MVFERAGSQHSNHVLRIYFLVIFLSHKFSNDMRVFHYIHFKIHTKLSATTFFSLSNFAYMRQYNEKVSHNRTIYIFMRRRRLLIVCVSKFMRAVSKLCIRQKIHTKILSRNFVRYAKHKYQHDI